MSDTLPFVISADRDRFDRPVSFLNGRFDVKVSGEDTGGTACVVDTIRTSRGGPPLHYHLTQSEWFFVRAGEFRFRVGDDFHHLRAGDSIFGPPGIPHAFVNLSNTGTLLIAFRPAETMEAFFVAGQGLDPRSQAFVELSRRHGMVVIGPPLDL
jgi:quercetin dioxygenase-like cupin family protein